MKYPDHTTYAKLYARYLRHDRLMALLKNINFENAVVADLCCGEGRVAMSAIERGAKTVFAVDECEDMMQDLFARKNNCNIRWSEKVFPIVVSVEKYLREEPSKSLNVIVCQQGINYWLTNETCQGVVRALKMGGIFAFNTFCHKPSTTPRILAYEMSGLHYVECSYLVETGEDSWVHHVQACEGIPPHITAFRWLSAAMLEEMLKPWFIIYRMESGNSAVYQCEKVLDNI